MNTNFAKIEEALNCQFPSEFKKYTSNFASEDIILKFFDDNYRILYSITKKTDVVLTEDVITLSEKYFNQELSDKFIVLPFAISLDKKRMTRYLFFLGEKGRESMGEVYVLNVSREIGKIRISKNINLLKGRTTKRNGKVFINCQNKLFEEILENFMSPSKPLNNIGIWADSFGIASRENTKDEKAKIDLKEINATIYEYEDISENFARLEVNYSIVTNNKIIISSKAYMVHDTSIRYAVEHNVNDKIFYHKFICALDCLKEIVTKLVGDGNVTEEEFNALFDMKVFINQVKKRFIQIDYGHGEL